ncbi:reverse transcriptase family protein [Lasius niger]|uniref:Reverse transcriptase family protein n=1 Tax=Lasius niger TaxID=67767 RepID=A0A0J7KHL6_LASNI|nr:reverse transcriptase family protein [Lasius niger]
MGETTVEVEYNKKKKYLSLIISEGGGCDILGRDWFEELGISVQGVFGIDGRNNSMKIYELFPTVFGGELGQFKGEPIKLELNEGTTPIFLKHRQVPFALKPAVEKELDKLVQ